MEVELVCRICLLNPKLETLMPTETDFYAQVEKCTGVLLTQDDCLPSKICTSCALLLRAALKLRALCQQAEQQLQRLKEDQEQQDQNVQSMPDDSDSDAASEFLESYEVTLETASNTSSQYSVDNITIKPSTPADTAVPASPVVCKPKHFKRIPDAPTVTSNVVSRKSLALSYVCKICNNVYSEKVKLTAHLKVHSEYKPHECEICHKRFRQTPQLARHMNSHTGLRPYKCDYCESSFADPSTRIKHQRIHTNERPYKCKYCSKSFAYSNVLNVHLKIHTGERPYSCQYCGRRFSQMHHKNTHERSHRTNKLDITLISVEEE